jgi:hypothetical protein
VYTLATNSATQKLLTILEANVAVELWTGKNVGQLVHGGFGNQQDAMLHRPTHSLTGDRRRQQKPADEAIGIGDDTLANPHQSFNNLCRADSVRPRALA